LDDLHNVSTAQQLNTGYYLGTTNSSGYCGGCGSKSSTIVVDSLIGLIFVARIRGAGVLDTVKGDAKPARFPPWRWRRELEEAKPPDTLISPPEIESREGAVRERTKVLLVSGVADYALALSTMYGWCKRTLMPRVHCTIPTSRARSARDNHSDSFNIKTGWVSCLNTPSGNLGGIYSTRLEQHPIYPCIVPHRRKLS
jgi:hypothetical protein